MNECTVRTLCTRGNQNKLSRFVCSIYGMAEWNDARPRATMVIKWRAERIRLLIRSCRKGARNYWPGSARTSSYKMKWVFTGMWGASDTAKSRQSKLTHHHQKTGWLRTCFEVASSCTFICAIFKCSQPQPIIAVERKSFRRLLSVGFPVPISASHQTLPYRFIYFTDTKVILYWPQPKSEIKDNSVNKNHQPRTFKYSWTKN